MILGLKFHKVALKYKIKNKNCDIITLLIKKKTTEASIVTEGVTTTCNLHLKVILIIAKTN